MSRHHLNRRLTIESLERRNLLCGNTLTACDFQVDDPAVVPPTVESGGEIQTDAHVETDPGVVPITPAPHEIGRVEFLPIQPAPLTPGPIDFVPTNPPLDFAPVEFNPNPPVVPVAPLPGLGGNDPGEDLASALDRAIQEASEELSRLQNKQPAPVPSLSSLPYINRLFKNDTPPTPGPYEGGLLMVTPRIIIQIESD